MHNIFHILEEAERKFPERKALVFQETALTFSGLKERVLSVAAGLESLGVTQGANIAVMLPNTPEFIYSLFAIARCGGTCVTLNPAYKKIELEYMLKDSEAQFIITTSKLFKTLLPLEISRAVKKVILTDGGLSDDPRVVAFQNLLDTKTQPEFSLENFNPLNTACIIYTNAQSGFPAGAELAHRGLIFDAKACVHATNMNENGVFLGALPFFHGFGVTTSILMPYAASASVVVLEKFSPEKVLAAIEKEKVTCFTGVPAMFGILSVYASKNPDLSSLPYVISGGSALTKDIKDRFEGAFNVPIIEGYGLTECSPVVSFNPINGANRFGSVGIPFPGVSVKIVNENGNTLHAGDAGEVWISGDLAMKGYYKNPEETKKYMTDGWVHTGDIGKLDEDGYLYLTGLKKKMVLVGGMNVYCAEVERILKSHPKVADAKIFGVDDALFGQVVNAEVKAKEPVEERELVDFCRENIASYKVPRKINVIMR